MFSVWGDPLVNADQTGTRLFQPFTPDNNIVLQYMRCRFIVFNDPNCTSIQLKIYSSDGGSPGLLLHSSTSRLYSEIQAAVFPGASDDYGFFESHFEFSKPALRGGVEYCLVVNGVWNFSTSSYIAWSKTYPDDPYFTDSTKHITNGPFHMRPITARL